MKYKKQITDIRQIQLILETAMDAVVTVDNEHVICLINPATIKMFGYVEEELIGQNVNILLPVQFKNHDQLINNFGSSSITSHIMNEGKVVHGKSKSGKLIPIETSLSKMEIDGKMYYNAFIRDVSYRIEAERLLKESEEKFRDVFNSMVDVFVRHDFDGKIKLISPSVYDVTGYTVDDVMDKNIEEFYSDKLQPKKLSQKVLESKSPHIFEIESSKKDGSKMIVSVNSKIWYDTKGNPKGIESVMRDVTQLNKVSSALKKSETNLKKAQKVAHLGSWYLDLLENNLFWTDENYKIFGIPIGTPMNYEKFLDVVHPEDRDYVHKKWSAAIEGEPYDIEYRLLIENEVKWVREKAELNFDNKGNPISGNGITQDITERKKAEKELNKKEKSLRLIYNTTADVLFKLQVEPNDCFRFISINRAFLTKTGLTEEQVVSKTTKEIIPEPSHTLVLEKYKEAIRDKRIIHWEETTEYPSGVIVGEVAVAPVFDEDGNCTHLIGSVHEITERKKAEEHILRYQQRLKKMATELTLTEERQRKAIASDLHDHVGQLISSSRLELAAIHDGMEKTDILSKLTSISKTLQEGIQATRTAIFNLSFPQLNEMGLFAAISDWLYEQIELKHGIKTLLTGPDQKYNLNETTRLLVFRSIRELLNNVLKHARATQVNVNIKSKATTLEITIRDDGVGFDLDSIGKRSGISGLGLFSIKERMEDIGGSISIQSKEGMGTKIILLVALANDN